MWGFNGNFKVEHDGTDLLVVHDGNRITKRGHPGTPPAGTWIPLEPGYSVFDDEDPKTIIIEPSCVRIH